MSRSAADLRSLVWMSLVSMAIVFGVIGVSRRNEIKLTPLEAKLASQEGPLSHSDIKALLTDYKRWTLVNSKPYPMAPNVAVSCRKQLALGMNYRAPKSLSPHAEKFLKVYVNGLARDPMFDLHRPRFSAGSIIVKQKLRDPEATQPELLTVVVKRHKDFSPGNGDWEYFVLDGDAKTVQASGKLANCQSCHRQAAKTDYVFRPYLAILK